jgi:hypothetical protein
MRRAALLPPPALALALALLAGRAGDARAQGVVLDARDRPLPVARVRALLVFQERTLLNLADSRPNRQDLLLELELAGPAPAGARWFVARPETGGAAGPGPRLPLEEVAAYWRSRAGLPAAAAWPEPAPAPPEFRLLPAAGLPGELRGRLPRGWTVFCAEVPEGCRRLGPALLGGAPLVALYPGALGATPPEAAGARWTLPATELMVLHSHFINVDDNVRGVSRALGLERRYQDEGVLAEGRSFWRLPRRGPDGSRPAGSLAGPGMEATAGLLASLATDAPLWLTVVEGRPAAPDASALDFRIVSHYPSAIDTTEPRLGFVALGVTTAIVMVLAAVLLKRRQLA